MNVLTDLLLNVVTYACLALQAWALIDCAVRPTAAYTAAEKLTKPAWLAITGGALAVGYFTDRIGLFGLVTLVASIVYLVDVRPAVRAVQGGGNRWS